MLFSQLAPLPTAPGWPPTPQHNPIEIPLSGEWSNPESWSHLFETAGVPAAILLFFIVGFGIFFFFAMWWSIGPKGFIRHLGGRAVTLLEVFLGRLEENTIATTASTSATQVTLQEHMKTCSSMHLPGGPACISDLRRAAPSAVSGMREMSMAMDNPEATAFFDAAIAELRQGPSTVIDTSPSDLRQR